MFDSLAGYLRFDPLLVAAVILAITLGLGRLVDIVRARLEGARESADKAQSEIAGRLKTVDVTDANES